MVRWWDGETWTSWLASDDTAPAPEIGAGGLPPERNRSGLLIGLGVVVLVLGLGALTGVVALQQDETVTGPAIAPPAPIPSSEVANRPKYNETTREADVGGLIATMPGDPFYDGAVDEVPGVLGPARLSQAWTEANFDGDKDWYSTCIIGIIDEKLVVDGDIAKTGENLWKELDKSWYVGVETTDKPVGEPQTQQVDGLDVYTKQVDRHVSMKGLKAKYDRMTMIVLDLGDGRYGVWAGSRPDNMKKPMMEEFQKSLDSLRRKNR